MRPHIRAVDSGWVCVWGLGGSNMMRAVRLEQRVTLVEEGWLMDRADS